MSDERPRPLVHPGKVLRELFMEPLGLSQNKLAEALDVDPGRISGILTGESGITADMALRLARYFGTTPQVWMNRQSKYDLEVAEERHGGAIERNVRTRLADEIPVPLSERKASAIVSLRGNCGDIRLRCHLTAVNGRAIHIKSP